MATLDSVFIDTSAFIALTATADANHARAVKIASRLEQGTFITTDMVIAEALTVMAMRLDKKLALAFGERVRRGGVQIIHTDDDIFERAWQIFVKEKNKNVSFVDCLSFAVIASRRIPAAFSFDHDFRNRGFEVLG